MPSQAQLEANRRNAQKSTGPRTPEGRAAVRFNALKHGLTARHAVIRDEDPAQFDEFLQAFRAELQPAGLLEHLLVDQMAVAAWRLQRARFVETGAFDERLLTRTDWIDKYHPEYTSAARFAYAMSEGGNTLNPFGNLCRYQANLERSFYKAFRELTSLRRSAPPPENYETNPTAPPNPEHTPDPSPLPPLPEAVEEPGAHGRQQQGDQQAESTAGEEADGQQAVLSRAGDPVPREGNVNVSRIESAVIGTGGFIDIAQKARKLVFCGTLTARGTPKFVPRVKQITFSGPRALLDGHEVFYVTESAVFRLTAAGVELIEVAPGISAEGGVFTKMAFRPAIASPLAEMPPQLFQPELLPPSLFQHFR